MSRDPALATIVAGVVLVAAAIAFRRRRPHRGWRVWVYLEHDEGASEGDQEDHGG